MLDWTPDHDGDHCPDLDTPTTSGLDWPGILAGSAFALIIVIAVAVTILV